MTHSQIQLWVNARFTSSESPRGIKPKSYIIRRRLSCINIHIDNKLYFPVESPSIPLISTVTNFLENMASQTVLVIGGGGAQGEPIVKGPKPGKSK